jgi:hypothetical protein
MKRRPSATRVLIQGTTVQRPLVPADCLGFVDLISAAWVADGPRERGGRDGRVFGSGAGRNRADAGAQLTGDVELRRVLNLAQSVPCLLVKAQKLVCAV